MAEHDADREPQPIDEDAAWAAIVAGYGEEPADPPGAKPFKSVEDLALLESDRNRSDPSPPKDKESGTTKADLGPVNRSDAGPGAKAPGAAEADDEAVEEPDREHEPDAKPDKPSLGGSIVFAPGVGGAGPRDYVMPEPKDDDLGDGDEGHFVPPEPPPLPEADVTAKFAWLAVIGGPVLMLLAVLLQWEMTWWLTTVCIGGFLGGFVTLVARMQHGDEEDDDPGRGAVV
ncbi:hypothetical protein SSPS47_08085 [Streptomyces sp. S4.7]|uniref:hypothetical protein n=1 Tax=Streptomyces sp. S4.7 TaxID=2705439 RepID=UPI0013983C9C|nr:hypothetical protein [Streptomyces sp. S4.7]QHY95079.1 hypothetical protein SSPS47_08085 [Streptomyces sp. S4.7]